MKYSNRRLIASAIAAAALFATAGARADLVYLPAENSQFQGSGLGSVNTVLTLSSPGSSSVETGAVVADGAGVALQGDALGGASQFGLPTLGALNITDTSALRIILNATEPAGNSITVGQLGLTFYDALNTDSITFTLAAPVVLASTLTGIGNAGFVFGLDAAQAAAASTFIAASSTAFSAFRVGLAASMSDATGGPDTFFIASGEPLVSAIPEPKTYALMLAGLGAIGFIARRRMR